jgi:carboxyl-terminal processing protease
MAKIRLWAGRLLMIAGLSGIGIALGLLFIAHNIARETGLDTAILPILRAAYILQEYYVDPVDPQKTKQRLLAGLVDHLDPHTLYLPPKEAQAWSEQLKGSYGGIGIGAKPSEDKKSLIIRDMADAGPARVAKLSPGDAIVAINGHPVNGKSLQDNFQMIRGPIGTSVELEIASKNGTPNRKVKVERAAIDLPAAQWALLDVPGGKVFLLRESHFNEDLIKQTSMAIQKAEEQAPGQIKGLILDLRDNPGGLITAAVGLSSFFGQQGALVVTSKARDPAQNQEWHATPEDWIDADPGSKEDAVAKAIKSAPWLREAPMVVIVNRRSASASEIVAGALKDWKRAIVVGNDTFGKGSVQSIVPLGAGNGSIKVTTSRYYTPSGKAIQAVGVPVDIRVASMLDRGAKEADLPKHLKGEGASEVHGDPLDPDAKGTAKPLDLKDPAVEAELILEEQRSTFSSKLNPSAKDAYLSAAIKALKL